MSTEATGTPPAAPVANATAPAANPAPAPAADPTLDTRLAALSKREREIQQQIASFKQEKQGMVPKSELANLWKSDRSKLREMLGVSADELPDYVEKGNPAKAKEDPIQALRDELEGIKRQSQEESHAKAVKEIKSQITSVITQDKDAYELVNAFDATDMVFDLMVDHYKEHNEELDYKEAANQVESYLFDQFKRGAGAKKISSLFQTVSEGQKKETSPTLTGAAVSSPVSGLQRKLSQEESVQEAAKLIKWT